MIQDELVRKNMTASCVEEIQTSASSQYKKTGSIDYIMQSAGYKSRKTGRRRGRRSAYPGPGCFFFVESILLTRPPFFLATFFPLHTAHRSCSSFLCLALLSPKKGGSYGTTHCAEVCVPSVYVLVRAREWGEVVLCSPLLNSAPLSIIVASHQDADDIDNLPDKETTACQDLQNTRNDFPRVNTV